MRSFVASSCGKFGIKRAPASTLLFQRRGAVGAKSVKPVTQAKRIKTLSKVQGAITVASKHPGFMALPALALACGSSSDDISAAIIKQQEAAAAGGSGAKAVEEVPHYLPALAALLEKGLSPEEFVSLRSADAYEWQFVYGLGRRNDAINDGAANGEDDAGQKGVDPVAWQRRYARDVEETADAFQVLTQLCDSVSVASEFAGSNSDGSVDPEALEVVADDVVALAAKLASQTNAVQRVVARRLDQEDVVARISDTWTLQTVGRAGGEEAAIFAGELGELLREYINSHGWRLTDLSGPASSDGEGGSSAGSSEGVFGESTDADKLGTLVNTFRIEGEGVFRYLQHEIGTHRVQRVPTTEKEGRMQTSTASVFMVPVVTTSSVNVKESDCDVEMVRGSGPGGQGMQSSSNCAVVRHRPSGISVKCHQSRSGNENKRLAMEMVAQQLWRAELQQSKQASAELFQKQWSTGDRSEKMRTYHWPQNRVTDHRVGKDWPLTNFMGDTSCMRSLHDSLSGAAHRANLERVLGQLLNENFPAA